MSALAWAVLAPLGGAVLCLAAGPRGRRWIALAATVATLAASLQVAFTVHAHGVVRHLVGGWGAPLGIELRADGIAALTLLAIGAVGALATSGAGGAGRPVPLWLLAWAALDALVLSADVFNLYVTLELATLAAVGLVAAGGDRDAAGAALRYLLVAVPGSLVYLLGVAVLYGAYATLDLAQLGARLRPDLASWTALALMIGGLCLKAAVFPLHAWLPPAYVAARPVAGALLAALVSKASFYVLLRLWLELVPPELGRLAGPLLGALGAGAVVWGSLLALRQRRLKALVAYSSVAQLGYLFLAFPLGSAGAWSGAVYLVVSHAAAKASLFLAAGAVERARGGDELDGLQGLARHLPVTFVSLALAGVGLMGMPPSGGFVAKWLLVRAAMERGAWWLAAVLLAGGLLAAAYVFRILRCAFLPPAGPAPAPLPRGAELPALALALLSLLLGVAPRLPLELLAAGSAP